MDSPQGIKTKRLGLASLERTIARMRSRITWIREGDACSRFFQIQASYRRQKNHIAHLKTEHDLATTPEEMAEALYNHYQGMMGSEGERSQHIDLAAIGIHQTQLAHLDEPFTENELWETINSMPQDKAPSPDRFTAEFYQSAWPIIK